MKLLRCSLASMLLVGAGVLSTQTIADEPKDWKVIAIVASVGDKPRIPISPVAPRAWVGGMVLRKPEELAQKLGKKVKPEGAEAWAAKLLRVERIDWGKQMLIVLGGGRFRIFPQNSDRLTPTRRQVTDRHLAHISR